MIVAVGVDVDPTFAAFVDTALALAVPVQVVNLRAAVDGTWRLPVPGGAATFGFADRSLSMRPQDAFFCRIINLSDPRSDAVASVRWQWLIAGINAWLDVIPGRVVNRSRGGLHNGSKPLHEAVLRSLHFLIPESLTSSNLADIRCFLRDGPTISKTVCGVRATSMLVSATDFENFEPEQGPVHLQRFIAGADARIHVVGEEIIAQRVTHAAIDYRVAGVMNSMEVFETPPALKELLVHGTQILGLEFAGWDFKIDSAGTYWCLEANPMPGYSPYDDRCGGAISRHLLRHLQSWTAAE
jgi:hypothetical protein